ncbi:MAG: valine--pyruvate transaminase [Gammaproteobacteria bacterium]|nr:valine--pyruvate transaminase [Gammaproteobacteria bacterium]
MQYSNFGQRFACVSGTRKLMDDLGAVARAERPVCNLGGGNPAAIPALQTHFRERMAACVASGEFDALIARYDDPQGYRPFLEAVAQYLNATCGWRLTYRNIVATAGSQASFFMLFNLFAGATNGGVRRILFPCAPEYMGYSELGVEPGLLRSCPARIELIGEHGFKYHVDFEQLQVASDVGAICVSRPSNPTGNVVTDEELEQLGARAAAAGVPLIVDGAYGLPFPGIVFCPATPVWSDDTILCLSLSKLGLPGLRTGIVVASEDVVQVLTSFNATLMLSNNPIASVLVTDLLASGELRTLCEDFVGPFYAERAAQAVAWCHESFAGLDYRIHSAEGAIFLWLWFPGLPIPVEVLYERLKVRGVLVIPGHHFTPGLDADWRHVHECLRVSYAQDSAGVRRGIGIIAEEVRKAWAER